MELNIINQFRENDKDFLKTIKEENETKNSNMDDSSMNKSNNQMKFIQKEEINMPFDEEMDQAAAKIQKHYRNKKKGGPEAENKKNGLVFLEIFIYISGFIIKK